MCVCETRVWIRVVKNGKIWDIHVTSLSQVGTGTATAEKDLICMRTGHCANTCHRKLYLNSSHAAAPLSTAAAAYLLFACAAAATDSV